MPAPTRLRAFAALWFCYFAAMGAYNPFLPLWMKDLGFSALAIGTVASLQAWTRVLVPYAWGWLGDHTGQRVLLIRCAAVGAALSAAGLLWAREYAWVALACTLLFVTNGGVVPLAEASLARHVITAGGMDSARYGRVRVWGSLGFVGSVLGLGLVFDVIGIGWFPVLAAAGWGVLVIAAMRLPLVTEPPHGHDSAAGVLAVLRRPSVAWFFASMFFTVLAHTGVYTFFSLYLDSQGHGKSTVGLLWALAAGCEVAWFWWQGRFFPRLQPHAWLQLAAALSVLRFALTAAFGASLAMMALAQALHAVTFGAQHAACIELIGRHFPGALRGRGQALYSVLGYGASGVIGGLAGGWLGSQFGFGSVFWASAGAAAVGWWCAARSARAEARGVAA